MEERAEGDKVLLAEEEEAVEDRSGDLETRPRRRKDTSDQEAAAVEEEAHSAAAAAAAAEETQQKVEGEGEGEGDGEEEGGHEEQRSVYYDREQATVNLDAAEVAEKKSQEDVHIRTIDQNMNETINSIHDVSSSLGYTEVDNKSELLKSMKLENKSSSHSYSKVYSSEITKNEDEIQETQEIKIVKTSKQKTTEYDLEKILEEQDTHDLYCPNCNSCITRRVILRKRKRTVREVQSDGPVKKVHEEQAPAGKLSTNELLPDNEISNQDDDQSPDVFRCLACFSFFIPTEGGYNIFRIFDKKERTPVQSSEQLPEKKESWFSSFFSSENSRKKGTESGSDVTGQDKKTSNSTISSGPTTVGKSQSTTQNINAGSDVTGQDKKTSNSTISSGPTTIGKSQSTTQNINAGAALGVEPVVDSKWQTVESGEKEITPLVNVSSGQTLIGGVSATTTGKNDSVFIYGDSIITSEQKGNLSQKNKQNPSSDISVKARIEENKNIITEINTDTPSHGISSGKEKMNGQTQYEPSTQISSPSGTIVHLKDQAVITDASAKIDAGKDIIQHVDMVSQGTQIIPGWGASDATSSPQPEVLIDVSAQSDRDAERIGRNNEWDVLKSIVYGGLIESITSLGIVSSAAGSNASTLNIFVLGLANLIGGLFLIIHNLFDLRVNQDEATDQKDERIGRYWDLLGRRKNFRLHFFVAVTSYLLFGLLPPAVYGFSFWKSDKKEYKLIAVAASALLCIALLAIAKAHVTKKTYLKTILYYLSLGVTASGPSYIAGILIDRLLQELGLFGQSTDPSSTPTITFQDASSTTPAWASY